MRVIEEQLTDRKQTVDRIFYLASYYADDLRCLYVTLGKQQLALSSLTFEEYYDFVKNIPYKRDNEPIEIVARPKIIFERWQAGIGKDCKKAAVLLGAYFCLKKIDWRLVVVSTRPDKEVHHIFTQADLNGQFVNVDATYDTMQIGQSKNCTYAECYQCSLF